MNEIVKVFENEEFGSVRTVNVDGEPWFVGKDVAAILGYSNASKAVSTHVDDEDKRFIMIDIADSQNGNVPSGKTKTALINESGLYSLILLSKLPNAKSFKRWVTSEVLPSIRKTGSYTVMNTKDDYILRIAYANSIEERAIALNELNNNIIKPLEEQNAVQAQQIAEYEPKVTYYDLVLQTKDVLSVTQIAKDYGKSANWLNEWLHNNGIQYKAGNTWVLYQKYADKGYTKTKTGQNGDRSWVHTYWTQKGRLFLYEKLKERDILPVIEQE